MNEYQKYENVGRDKFMKYADNQFDIWDYNFTDDEFNNVDCVLTSGETAYTPNVLIEIKDRKYKSTASFIEKEGAVFEMDKYSGMKKKAKEYNCDHLFYVNYFSDGVGYLFDIDELNKKGLLHWYKKVYSKHTAYDDGSKKMKIVCDLPLKYGIKIL